MPDPADVIAAILLAPPSREDTGSDTENGLSWQYRSVMGNPAAPALARCIAEAAIQALSEAGWKIVPGWAPPSSTLPSAVQVRTWLTDHGWTAGEAGPAGALWWPPSAGPTVAVPHDGDDPDAIAGAVKRIAEHEGRLAGQVAREMRQCPGE